MASTFDINEIVSRYLKADSIRGCMTSTWRDIANHVRPIKSDIGVDSPSGTPPSQTNLSLLFDSVGTKSNLDYAAGCMSWITPSETTWHAFEAPAQLKRDDAIQQWYAACTDETNRILANTNFYSQIHEVYLDDGAFGTSGLLIEEDASMGVRFETLQIGKYAILENRYREVDTLFFMFEFTARQAVQKFGRENLPPATLQCLDGADKDRPRRYLLVIMPRQDYERGKLDVAGMPWAVIWIDYDAKILIREEGTYEKPFACHRHSLWSSLPYGFSPGVSALPDMRQLNLMQMLLDTLVEKQVTPPVIAPAGYKGQIDLRRGGITFSDPQGQAPRFWENPGNYLIGEDRIEFRRRQIQSAFHVDMFQALASIPIGKDMTAAEVNMRQRDRLTLFSPTFGRKTTELITPIMRRVFAILLRAGAFPNPPANLVMERDGLPFIPDPEITYTGRLALQLRAIHNDAYLRVMDSVAPLIGISPEVMDHFDVDKIVRDLSRNEGLRSDWLRDEQIVEQIRMSRAEAQAAAQAQAEALQEADATAKLLRAA